MNFQVQDNTPALFSPFSSIVVVTISDDIGEGNLDKRVEARSSLSSSALYNDKYIIGCLYFAGRIS
jgi:hypothetical protein